MNPVLLDTGCIVALLDRSELFHERCKAAATMIKGSLITSEIVIQTCFVIEKTIAKVGHGGPVTNISCSIEWRRDLHGGKSLRQKRDYEASLRSSLPSLVI